MIVLFPLSVNLGMCIHLKRPFSLWPYFLSLLLVETFFMIARLERHEKALEKPLEKH